MADHLFRGASHSPQSPSSLPESGVAGEGSVRAYLPIGFGQVGVGLAVALAVWPVWSYLAHRIVLRQCDPIGVWVLLGAVCWGLSLARGQWERREALTRWHWTLALVLGLYAISYPLSPALLRGVFGLLAVVLTAFPLAGLRWRERSGLALLVVLAAPSTESLAFFLGGPLRALTTPLTALWLSLCSVPAEVQGTSLRVAGGLVSVDAPCSGVNGVWTAAVCGAVLAAARGWTPMRTLLLVGIAAGLALPANVLRATVLVLWIRLGSPSGWLTERVMHEVLGLLVFVAWGFLILSLRFPDIGCRESSERSHRRACSAAVAWITHALRRWPRRVFRWIPRSGALAPGWIVLLCVLAAVAPLQPEAELRVAGKAPRWPSRWLGAPLRSLPPTDMDRTWAADDPIARFAMADGSELLLRWLPHAASRGLHPVEDCYRAHGYEVDPLPPTLVLAPGPVEFGQDGDDRVTHGVWRRFLARRAGGVWEVRSAVLSVRGPTYSDLSWWWWQVSGPAARDRGPWFSATIRRRLLGTKRYVAPTM